MKPNLYFSAIVIVLLFSCRKSDMTASSSFAAAASTNVSNSILGKDFASLIQPRSDDFPSIPQDPGNLLSAEKVQLGNLLFHETRLGVNSKQPEGLHTYSCATCHHAEAGFESGLYQALGEGGSGFGMLGETRTPSAGFPSNKLDVQSMHTPTSLNTAYQPVMGWNGRLGAGSVNTGTESLWKTANGTDKNLLGFQGLETLSFVAFGGHNLTPDTAWLATVPEYKNLFDLAFPEVAAAQRVSVNSAALAIAAYQRTLLANQSPFQLWLQGDSRAMTPDMVTGMNIFFGKAKCSKCHYGPALNSVQFYALGFADLQNGVNGSMNVNTGTIDNKGRGGFTTNTADNYKFKVPQLYNLKDAMFYGHGSSFNSIEAVIRYKNTAISQNPSVPASQLAKQFVPLNLTEDEISKLVIFVRDALYDPNLMRYETSYLPSGQCIPNNDAQSKIDRGCQ